MEGEALKRIYPVQDPRGSISKWIQSDGVTVLGAREYDAFGQGIPNSAWGSWPRRYSYQGQTWMRIASGDQSQSLLLSPFRLYSPEDGVFIQNEPLLHRRRAAGYKYARQNPVQFVDVLGLQEQSCSCPSTKHSGKGKPPELWTFSGINSFREKALKYGQYPFEDYVYASLERNLLKRHWGKLSIDSVFGKRYSVASLSGLGLFPGMDYHRGGAADSAGGVNIVANILHSRGILDTEADTWAQGHKLGSACECGKKRRVRILMMAPKTHTPPPQSSDCCEIEFKLFFDPSDIVPNQGLHLGPLETDYWLANFGPGVSAVLSDNDDDWMRHSVEGYLRRELPLFAGVEVAGRRSLPIVGPRVKGPLAVIEEWMLSAKEDDIVVACHSQGCNIAMQVLNRACYSHRRAAWQFQHDSNAGQADGIIKRFVRGF